MGIQARRQRSQVLLMFAISSAALLAAIGLLYSFGFVLADRRSLQTAADAASLSGTWQVLAELQSDDRSDARVQAAIVRYAASNGVANSGDVSFAYLGADGTTLARAEPFAAEARGVRVTVNGRPATFLPGFVGAASVLVQTSASALARTTASPSPETQALPIGVARSAYAAHSTVDLFTGAKLDLRSAGAPSYADMSANLQFWSDGQDPNGSVAVDSTLNVVTGTFNDALAAGLHDNVRRQNLRDGSGAMYGLVSVPIVDSTSGPTARVVGFARFKLRDADISSSAARGVLVPYPAGAFGTPTAGTDFGAVFVTLTQ